MKKNQTIQLRLYVTENAPHSNRAVVNLKTMCNHWSQQKIDYEILDIHKYADLAVKDHIQVIPTLLRRGSKFSARVIGDLSNYEVVKEELRLMQKN